MNLQILLIAKTPVPGRVKTRLCPPCTPEQAAAVAAAALADTVGAISATPAAGRTLVVDGDLAAPAGWGRVTQHGPTLGDRLSNAFSEAAAGRAALLLGMDTPQAHVSLLRRAAALLRRADAVLGPAEDGGWWALGLRDPAHAEVLRHIATSTPTTGAETLDALRRRGLRVAALPRLRDVDTAADAHAVAALCDPAGRFARAVAANVPVHADRAGLAAVGSAR